ncbi:glycoside hydrolase family 3 protein [Diplodia corticola]|uniref:beta-glucosidase n=1 Tax=Diplodia corticola TaxID=236234 RepID=A0A1J9RKK7_9PEZI|nr:glycoside hydrolase family 3 protein [Diplodia corticola]OJD33123.1 glycoside hydrolase family 3 protein [Diplodia corticola]
MRSLMSERIERQASANGIRKADALTMDEFIMKHVSNVEAEPWDLKLELLLNKAHWPVPATRRSLLWSQLGWRGLAMSDWGGTNSTAESIDAGMHLEMPGPTRWRRVEDVKAALGDDVELLYAKGAHTFRLLPPMGEDRFDTDDYSNPPPVGTKNIPTSNWAPILSTETAEAGKLTGTFRPSKTGNHHLGFSGLGPCKLFINGELVSEQPHNHPEPMAFNPPRRRPATPLPTPFPRRPPLHHRSPPTPTACPPLNTSGLSVADRFAAGGKVVQVYAGPAGETAVEMAVKQLVGFERVELAPGETKAVRVAVPVRGLAYFEEGVGKGVVEKGEYRIMVGESSVDILESWVVAVAERLEFAP